MEPERIPYIAFESVTAKQERTIRRLWILCIILVLLLVGSNALWIYHESQMETVMVTQDNADGVNNFVGNDGDIINGKTDSEIPQEKDRR